MKTAENQTWTLQFTLGSCRYIAEANLYGPLISKTASFIQKCLIIQTLPAPTVKDSNRCSIVYTCGYSMYLFIS